jgi:hypothetical protein
MAEALATLCTRRPRPSGQRQRHGAAQMAGTPNGTVGVAVFGAAGTIAAAIVADLAVSDEVGRMLLPDMGETRGCEFSVER